MEFKVEKERMKQHAGNAAAHEGIVQIEVQADIAVVNLETTLPGKRYSGYRRHLE